MKRGTISVMISTYPYHRCPTGDINSPCITALLFHRDRKDYYITMYFHITMIKFYHLFCVQRFKKEFVMEKTQQNDFKLK